jgi:hypothetical protein
MEEGLPLKKQGLNINQSKSIIEILIPRLKQPKQ